MHTTFDLSRSALPVLDANGHPSRTGYGAADPAGHAGAVRASAIDAQALAAELKRTVSGEVRFDDGSRAAYSTDGSNYRQVPIGVVLPKTEEDVLATVAACRKFGAPITSRGGGTSLAGQCTNVAVILDCSKYFNQLLAIDVENKTATIRPGIVLDELRNATREHGLTFGPDPATHSHNTLGGMMGNNSCGIHSVMAEWYGPGPRTEDNVVELEVLTYDGERFTVGPTSEAELEKIIGGGGRRGEIYRQIRDLRDRYAGQIKGKFPDIPRRVSGYNLPSLLPENECNLARALIGSEGTLVVILKAKVALMPEPKAKSLLVLGYPSVFEAGDHAPDVMKHKPIGLEGIDGQLVSFMKKKGLHPDDVKLLPEGKGWLLCEFGGDTKEESDAAAKKVMEELKDKDDPPTMKLFDDEWEEQKLWQVRESGLGATAHVPDMPEAHPGWEDAAVPPDNVGPYLRDFRDLLDRYGYQAALYGHFGQGCIHCRITFDLKSRSGVQDYLAFIDDAADLVIKHGGSLSGEHGDGQARAALLPKMFGDEIVQAFRDFKAIWDPQGKMNPGKIVEPYLPDENLRAGPNYHPWDSETHFKFPDDGGSFHKAANRCVGVGKCRRHEGGVMCPSYMVTREEEDSTRGRARLLFEMFQGDVLADGWRDDAVREALDLCLACKGCKHECPVNVDMATYKAEFLSHYYEGRLRPVTGYTMGLIYWWARLASRMPALANFVTQTEPFATAVKTLGGIAQQRQVPTFADPTFTAWFRARDGQPKSASSLRRLNARARVAEERPLEHADLSGEAGPRGASAALRHAHVPRHQSETYSHGSDSGRNGQGNAKRSTLNPFAEAGACGHDRVLLWPDTFNNYLTTEAAKAAVEVLEAAGFAVEIPPRPLCCGRPLYDWGMLDLAEHLWHQTLDVLRPYIRAGIPVVGLEPSCVAAFRDELKGLFPNDEDACRLSEQTYLFSEFLEQEGVEIPQLEKKALVHGHCHHKAVMHMDAEISILKKLGLDYEVLDAGCCGMAGAFGFEADHYDVSIACGERVLLPRVREAAADTLLIANGFSCREQIEQTTDRKALHLAEVVRMAMEQGPSGPSGRPEDHTRSYPAFASNGKLRQVALAGAVAAGGAVGWRLARR